MVQLLRLYAPNMGGPVLVPGQGAKIPHVTTERCHNWDPAHPNK